MRKAGADPTGNITKIMDMLQEQTGGKFTPEQTFVESRADLTSVSGDIIII
jgi:hypothetical protein